jgi:hypothetical protein
MCKIGGLRLNIFASYLLEIRWTLTLTYNLKSCKAGKKYGMLFYGSGI